MEIQKQLVSIGLPTYNRASILREAFDSLLNQTYTNFELIISDNASTDDTQKICEEYAVRDSRIRYIKQKENIGMTNNFNFVLQEAKGEYFMWAADDDLWDKDFIRYIIYEYKRNARAEPIGLIATRWKIQDLNTIDKNARANESIGYYRVFDLTFRSFLRNACFNAVYIYGIYNREVLMKIGGVNRCQVAFSDILILLQLLCVSKVKIIEKELFFYRQSTIPFLNQFYRTQGVIRKFAITGKRFNLFFRTSLFNLHFRRMAYLLKRTNLYYHFNKNLIYTYHRESAVSLTILNFISSLQLFLLLFLCDVRMLEKKDKKIFGYV